MLFVVVLCLPSQSLKSHCIHHPVLASAEVILAELEHLCGSYVLGLCITHGDHYMHSLCPHSTDSSPCLRWKSVKTFDCRIPTHINGFCVFIDRLLLRCPSHSGSRTFQINHRQIQWTNDRTEFQIILDKHSNEPQNWRVWSCNYQTFGCKDLECNYKNIMSNKNDLNATWITFKNDYNVNLKMLLNTTENHVESIYNKYIHRINKRTFQNFMQSILISKVSVLHAIIKFNNFSLPNKIFGHDGSYKELRETGYRNVGILNCVNGYCLCIDKILLSSRGESHCSIIDVLALNLFQQLVIGNWSDEFDVHGEYLWVVDRPKTDRFLPRKIVQKLWTIFGWNKKDGKDHKFWNLRGDVLIDLDLIIPGPIIADIYHFEIHWSGKGAFNKKHSRMGDVALKDVNHCLRCCLVDPNKYLYNLDHTLLPYQFWAEVESTITTIIYSVCYIVRLIIWLKFEIEPDTKWMISSKIHCHSDYQTVVAFLRKVYDSVHDDFLGYTVVRFIKLDQDWINERQSIELNGRSVYIPKHTVGRTIVKIIGDFIGRRIKYRLFPYQSAKQFHYALIDVIEFSVG